MDIVNAYQELGSYRATAELCGTTHKTVRRIVERQRTGRLPPPRNGRATEQRLRGRSDRRAGGAEQGPHLGQAAACRPPAPPATSARSATSAGRRRGQGGLPPPAAPCLSPLAAGARRPPGDRLGRAKPFPIFCAVLAWSRWRFVRFAADRGRETVLALLAECFECIGGVPSVVLADRMAGLRARRWPTSSVPHPDYVRFATRYGFRPDFCEAADPESKGMVENLVGYAQSDLLLGPWPFTAPGRQRGRRDPGAPRSTPRHSRDRRDPDRAAGPRTAGATAAALAAAAAALPGCCARSTAWPACASARRATRCRTPWWGTAWRCSPRRGGRLPHDGGEVARHPLVAPGEVSLRDEHYGGPAKVPARALRPKKRRRARPSSPWETWPSATCAAPPRPARRGWPRSWPRSSRSRAPYGREALLGRPGARRHLPSLPRR